MAESNPPPLPSGHSERGPADPREPLPTDRPEARPSVRPEERPAGRPAAARQSSASTPTQPATDWNWMWLAFGIIFFVSYFIPIYAGRGDAVWFWDLFRAGANPAMGVFVTYLVLVGIALPIIAYLLGGIGRDIAVLSMGAFGMLLLAIAVAGTSGGADLLTRTSLGGGDVLFVFALLALAAALVGNAIRHDHTQSMLGKLMGAIGAGVFILFGLVGLIQELTSGGLRFRGTLEVLSFVVQLLGELALVAACVLLLVNLADSPNVVTIARTASLLVMISAAVLLGWGLVYVAAIAGRNQGALAAVWAVLFTLRFESFILGLFLMTAMGLYGLLKTTVLDRPALAAPAV